MRVYVCACVMSGAAEDFKWKGMVPGMCVCVRVYLEGVGMCLNSLCMQ